MRRWQVVKLKLELTCSAKLGSQNSAPLYNQFVWIFEIHWHWLWKSINFETAMWDRLMSSYQLQLHGDKPDHTNAPQNDLVYFWPGGWGQPNNDLAVPLATNCGRGVVGSSSPSNFPLNYHVESPLYSRSCERTTCVHDRCSYEVARHCSCS